MLVLATLTQEEEEHVQNIRNGYEAERKRLNNALEKLGKDNEEERTKLLLKRQVVIESLQADLESYIDKVQREHFKEIAAGGNSAIITHAKNKIPALLESIYREIKNDCKGATANELKILEIGAVKDGKLLINANYATQALKSALYIHIEALRDDKEDLRKLLEAIIEEVEASNLTDGAEITEEEKPVDVMRFRRSPLADITTYGLMNDKVNTQIVQDSGIFRTNPDGQIQLLWNVNQAPPKKEAVPVYVALTYDGLDTGLRKKLNIYDSAVYNAVSDLFYYWKRENPQKPLYITPQEIWRRMNGKQNRDGSAKPSEAQIKRICKSIDKMRHIDFYMDISEEIKAHYITLDDERLAGGYIKDYLLNCSEAGFYTEQGRKVTGYRVNYEPVLYTYNAAKDHVLFLPFDLLDTSSALSDSENVTEFKQYLLQQILLMKNAAKDDKRKGGKRFKRSNIILLKTIYKATGIKPPEERLEGREFKNEASQQTVIRRLRKADKDKIEGLLEAWKAKQWIKGYKALNSNNKPVGERQAVAAYEIQL